MGEIVVSETSTLRAFRPSVLGRRDEVDEEVTRGKLANMVKYTQRARLGLPIFDDQSQKQEDYDELLE